MINYHYLSPKILPIFGGSVGRSLFSIDPITVLQSRVIGEFSGTLEFMVKEFSGGKCQHEELFSFNIVNKKSERAPVIYEVKSQAQGYVEVHTTADKPIFKKILPEDGYAILSMGDRGGLTHGFDAKYASPRIVQQLRIFGNFCMCHNGVRSSKKNGQGNSLLLINPYERPITCKILGPKGKRLKVKVMPCETELIDLKGFVDDNFTHPIMLSASNRIPVFDVKHLYGDQSVINSIDHLDPFSGFPAWQNRTLLSSLQRVLKHVFNTNF